MKNMKEKYIWIAVILVVLYYTIGIPKSISPISYAGQPNTG